MFEKWTVEGQDHELVTEYIFKLINHIKRCQELAIENMVVVYDKQKFWYDKNVV